MVSSRFLFVALALAAALWGCDGGSTFPFVASGSGNQLAKSSSIAIAFQAAALPTLIATGSMTEISAVVSNDSLNAGVDWLVTCNDVDCGSLSLGTTNGRAIHSESNQPIIYTAPTDLTGSQLSINIVAFATADHTKNVVASINVTSLGI